MVNGSRLHRLSLKPYCIVYTIQDDELSLWIVKVGHRKGIDR
ncbi:MAG: type II toxin-antitoxin system RelE/ParE family toxin [Desulfovermiculus sp.]|nr:type II toxin-antitoxin system RelE/ParE family toxin [Desulfovermiculus sp.]